MNASTTCPSISVIMAAYNAERFILKSVQSVLAQTHADFELLVVNDASTDSTLKVLASIDDPRLRVLSNERNLGPVGSRNRAAQVARGRYIAIADADDLNHPTRFARQYAHLETHKDTLVLAGEMSTLAGGRIRRTRMAGSLNPRLVDWMLHIGNPVGHPSVMFRTELLQKLGVYLRDELRYAEDFDFLHRALQFGNIRVQPECLVIYRLHGGNLTTTRKAEVTARTAAVLAGAYEPLLGSRAPTAADLVARHIIAAEPLPDRATFEALGDTLSELVRTFSTHRRVAPHDEHLIAEHASVCWWQRVVLPSMRQGSLALSLTSSKAFSHSDAARPATTQLQRAMLSGCVPAKKKLRSAFDRVRALTRGTPRLHLGAVGTVKLREQAVQSDDPPVLFVVVDTEAAFDWSGPFRNSDTNVTSVGAQGLAQGMFGDMGIRPIYVVDYPVASQPEGYEPLRKMFEARQCVIGAHLHPWTTPPLEEAVNDFNSYQCNLDPALEIRKIAVLKDQIERSFGAAPLFFKAGRYGVGPRTFQALSAMGFAVDLSIMPLADFRADGGPDFRDTRAMPYAVQDSLLSLPMTRGQIGLLTPTSARVHRIIQSPALKAVKLTGILARLHLVNTVTLTPEGISAEEQIGLIRALFARGTRHFVLHYHSPSLVPGNTPYVRSQADLAAFLGRIETVCRFFIDDLGGLAGNPADLVPQHARESLWPKPAWRYPAQAPLMSVVNS
jgi:hypothetical protein